MRLIERTAPGGGFTLTRYEFETPEEKEHHHDIDTSYLACRTCGHRPTAYCEIRMAFLSPSLPACDSHETPEVLGERRAREASEAQRREDERAEKTRLAREEKMKRQQENQQGRRKS